MGSRLQFALGACIVAGALFTGCASDDVSRAFKPETEAAESNKVIIKYCTSCHTHQSFGAVEHLAAVQGRYKQAPFSAATECRACHTYSVSWMGDEVRGTHWPAVKEP